MSVTVPPKGTRGAFFPRFLSGFASRMMLRQFRRKRGARTQGGLHALHLETRGAKSGQVRHAILGYIEEPTGSWLVIGSAVGAARHPAWVHNLAREPQATVEFGDGRRVAVQAESVGGEDLARAWERIAAEAPEYVRYRSKTDRDIPVIRLRPR
jgi:deazaflavin-dependent oxidoreductase (nitroreductase family)